MKKTQSTVDIWAIMRYDESKKRIFPEETGSFRGRSLRTGSVWRKKP